MKSLIRDNTLTFTRYSAQTEDDFGDVINGTASTIETSGSLQPFRRGDVTSVLPEGKKAEDARVYYTSTALRAADPYEQTQPDETTISGRKFQVFDVGDWATTTIFRGLAHYKVVLLSVEEGVDGP